MLTLPPSCTIEGSFCLRAIELSGPALAIEDETGAGGAAIFHVKSDMGRLRRAVSAFNAIMAGGEAVIGKDGTVRIIAERPRIAAE